MDNDFKPAKRPAKSLRTVWDERGAKTTTPAEPKFETPEEAAARDDIGSNSRVVDEELPDTSMPSKPAKKPGSSWREKLTLHWPPGRKEYITAACLVLVIAAAIGGFFALQSEPPKPVAKSQPKKAAAPAPKTIASTLTGLQVDPTINQRPVTGVMIENSMEARPQSGLSEAGVVFEAVAEGGITRFLAVFQDTWPGDVGPVRSARPYYLHWALGFDANYAHVGGSPDALAAIKTLSVRDLDQFANAGAYRRVPHRAAPHNVYTSIEGLTELGKAKGLAISTYTGFERKSEAPSKQPNAKSVDLQLSGPQYNVHYDYVPATNSYNRSEGGAAHMDANGNRQISPKVVVAMVLPYSTSGKYSVYGTVGSGPVFVFQDGIVTTGQWAKASEKAQITFTDGTGKPLKLNPGQTWITAVADSSKVIYAP